MSIDEKTSSMSENLSSGKVNSLSLSSSEERKKFSQNLAASKTSSENKHTHAHTTGTKTVYLPTYKMGPDPDSRFQPNTVHKLANDVLFKNLSGVGYEDQEAKRLSLALSDEIKAKIRTTSISNRYKIIVQVTIGEKKRQAVRCTSRCLWDKSTDNYTTVNYQNESLWAVATIFGLYTE